MAWGGLSSLLASGDGHPQRLRLRNLLAVEVALPTLFERLPQNLHELGALRLLEAHVDIIAPVRRRVRIYNRCTVGQIVESTISLLFCLSTKHEAAAYRLLAGDESSRQMFDQLAGKVSALAPNLPKPSRTLTCELYDRVTGAITTRTINVIDTLPNIDNIISKQASQAGRPTPYTFSPEKGLSGV